MRTLDRSNPSKHPVATITGRHEKYPDARFEQDGLLFRADGTQCAGQNGAAAPTDEADDVATVREWVDAQKGAKGKRELAKYAKTLGVKNAAQMGIQALRDTIVEAFEAQANG